MPCYFPVTLYLSRAGRNKETGKWPLTSIKDGYIDKPKKVPCGRCIGCRLERSRQWAVRIMHEADMHDSNRFLTFTYRDEELVYGGKDTGILYPRHLELFWKRLRKRYGKGIRYFACGEYGDESCRPHYHAIVFGINFEDEEYHSSKNGVRYYCSRTLDSLWTHGNCIIGDVTFESAAYVARYIMKKRLGKDADSYMAEGVEPEFVRMSRRPGIGSTWFDKYESDVFPRDYVVIRGGTKVKPPKYYSGKYELTHPLTMEDIKQARLNESYTRWRDNTPERLAVRYRVKQAQIKGLVRGLE